MTKILKMIVMYINVLIMMMEMMKLIVMIEMIVRVKIMCIGDLMRLVSITPGHVKLD